MWCEVSVKLSDTGSNNVREDEFNPRLGYNMVRLDSLHKTCIRGVTGYRRVLRTMYSELLDWIELRI